MKLRFLGKIFLVWIVLSILMVIYWMAGLMAGNILLPDALIQQTDASALNSMILLFVTCLLDAGVILLYIYNTKCAGLRLSAMLFLIMFGVMYLLPQLETWWFERSVKIPVRGIFLLIMAGAFEVLMFSLTATWLTGRFRFAGETDHPVEPQPGMIRKVLVLIIVIWPAVYFLAGYFIAWQFRTVRVFYSGSGQLASLVSMMKENIRSGLYLFQVFRGLLWVMIAVLVLRTMRCGNIKKGVILGLLFTVLGSAQLLIPNPYMPEPVRMVHLLETSVSNFIWGVLVALVLYPPRPVNQNAR